MQSRSINAYKKTPNDKIPETISSFQSFPISIIVPAHNAESYLSESLKALVTQKPPAGEVIVVDDHSDDRSGEIALEMGVTLLRVSKNAGPSHARNLGAMKARGEILFFVDADVVLMPGAVQYILDLFSRRPDIDAVFGSYDVFPRANSIVSQYRNLLHHYTHQCGQSEAITFWSACGAIRREIFLELGGFDESSFPRCIEDIELGYRLKMAGRKILLDKGLQGTHLKQWTFWSMVKTDVFCRAIPWTRLESERPKFQKDLNIRFSQKMSVALLGLALLAMLGMLWNTSLGGVAAVLLICIIVINFGLYWFFLKQQGIKFAIIGIVLHLLYFLYSGMSFLYVWICLRLKLPIRDNNMKDL
jgi:glycosyltransferase involved in cell wall biosynthesis